jgi:hypothetical protein
MLRAAGVPGAEIHNELHFALAARVATLWNANATD